MTTKYQSIQAAFVLCGLCSLSLQAQVPSKLFPDIQNGPADSPSCSVEYEKVGCYQDDLGSRALPQLLVTDRDTSSPVFSEQLFNWKEPEASMTSLACRCAVAAKSKSYEHFGLQFYAECWGGVNASSNYQMHGPTVRCIDSKYQVCNKETSAVCVGEAASNFVYKIVKPKCLDNYPICKHYASINLCTKEYPLVLEYCRKSCKLC